MVRRPKQTFLQTRQTGRQQTRWKIIRVTHHSVQFSSVTQSCLTLCDPMNRTTPGLFIHHQLPESTQTHVHWVSDAVQPTHSLSSPSPPALNLSQHRGLFKWVSSSYQVAKVLELQLQHQSKRQQQLSTGKEWHMGPQTKNTEARMKRWEML